MRKKYFSILLIIILYILFITFNFIMYHKIDLYIICIGLPYSVLCLVLSLLMHELSHALAASLLGLKVYCVYSLPFTFVKNDSRWYIKDFSFVDRRILGQVLFKLTEMKSNQEYKDIVFKVAITNIVGPLTSLIFALLFIGLSLSNNTFIPYTSLPFLISVYVGINSLFLGDGKSAYLFIYNNEFALNMIFDIYIYNNKKLFKYDNEFLLDLMINKLEENYLRDSVSTINANNMCMHYLLVQYYLVYDIKKLPEITKKFIDDIVVQKENLITNNELKTLIIPFFHLIIIYLIVIRQGKNARMIFGFLVENVNHSTVFYKYLKLRSEYYLDYKIEIDYLMDQKEEICNHFFYNMEGFYALEENIILLKNFM